MIRYDLRCAKGHHFDGWFRSSDAYDSLRAAGQITCTTCGATEVEKAMMAPAVSQKERKLTAPRDATESALEKLRAHVEANSDYVGLQFADQARAMHEGILPARQIHGEARPDEARKLIEDGVPVAPLPFLPRQKAN